MNFKTHLLKCIIIVGLCLTTLFAKAQDPNTTVVCEGQTRTLTSEATGTTYQWFKNGVLITGASERNYDALGDALPGAKYTVVALNEHGCASDASDPVIVVNAPTATPTIAVTNNNSCQTETNEVVLTGSGVPAAVPAGLTYKMEWKKGTTVVGTGSTLTLKNVLESGDYTLTITPVWKSKEYCSVTSTATKVTIHPFAAKAIISTAISGFQTADEQRAGIVCERNTITFTAAVSSTDPNITATGLTYQWYKNGAPLAGETGMTLELTDLKSADNGNYTVKTKTVNGCEATSDVSVLDVKARLGKPAITFID